MDKTNYVSRSLGNDFKFKQYSNEILYSNINDINMYNTRDPDFFSNSLTNYKYQDKKKIFENSNNFKIIKVENDQFMLYRALVYSLKITYNDNLDFKIETEKAIQVLAFIANNIYTKFDQLKPLFKQYKITNPKSYILNLYQTKSEIIPELIALSIDQQFKNLNIVIMNINYKIEYVIYNGNIFKSPQNDNIVYLKYWNKEKTSKLNSKSNIQSLLIT